MLDSSNSKDALSTQKEKKKAKKQTNTFPHLDHCSDSCLAFLIFFIISILIKTFHASDLHGIFATCFLTSCDLVLPQPCPSVAAPVVHSQSWNPLIFSQSSHPFFFLSTVDLQYCVGFKCIGKWSGDMHVCVCVCISMSIYT